MREGRGCGPDRRLRLPGPDAPGAGAARREAARTSPSSRAPTWASSRTPSRSRCIPTAHYAMGGIPTNVEARCCATTPPSCPGLYAAGEVACVSVHGANRLGTNSLLDINVFGKRAGIAAAEYADDAPTSSSCPRTRPADRARPGGGPARRHAATERVAAIRKALQETMDRNAQVFRTEESLKQALEEIEELRERYKNVSRPGQGQAVQHRPARGRRARATCSTSPRSCVVGALHRKESPRRSLPRGLPEPRRRELHAAHDGVPRGAGDDGTRVTSASTTSRSSRPATSRWSVSTDDTPHSATTPATPRPAADRPPVVSSVTFRIRRFDPEVDDEPHWEDLRRRARLTDRRARRPAQDQVGESTAR